MLFFISLCMVQKVQTFGPYIYLPYDHLTAEPQHLVFWKIKCSVYKPHNHWTLLTLRLQITLTVCLYWLSYWQVKIPKLMHAFLDLLWPQTFVTGSPLLLSPAGGQSTLRQLSRRAVQGQAAPPATAASRQRGQVLPRPHRRGAQGTEALLRSKKARGSRTGRCEAAALTHCMRRGKYLETYLIYIFTHNWKTKLNLINTIK